MAAFFVLDRREATDLGTLSDTIQPKIDTRDFDGVESIWMSELERDASRIDDYLEVAKRLRKAEERTRADTLLDMLAESLREQGLWRERLVVLREMARLSRKPVNSRPAIREALDNLFADRPMYERILKAAKFGQSDDVVAESEKVESWMNFDAGEYFFMAGRGPGVIVELNPELGVCRLDFEREKRVSVPLGAAQKFLAPLPPGHFLRGRFEDPDAFRTSVTSDPAASLESLLRSFGRAMTAGEVKEALIGTLPESRWSTWWTAARKSPRIVAHGTGAKATYTWTATTAAADASIQKKFDRASLRDKLDLARKHSARSPELADRFAATLAREAEKVVASNPALAWEVFATLERLPGEWSTNIDSDQLIITGAASSRIIGEIPDRQLREKAIALVREKHPDRAKVLSELFMIEQDPRVISIIHDALVESGENEIRERLIEETLRYPRRHPHAFFWYLSRLESAGETPDRRSWEILQNMLEAISLDEFTSFRARLREFFDKGALAVRIINQDLTEEQTRKLYETIERYAGLEDYRREIVRNTALMRFPSLREPQVEPLFATAEKLREKREEFERLKTVEIPANLKAIQEAREMGDLRENFEYKAARQRQEYLAARTTELQNELARVRVIDFSEVDTSEIRVGTSASLSNGDVHRKVTILGPWESSPETGVYSNQSEVAKALMGHKVGEIVSFMGNDYRVDEIGKGDA